MTSRFADSFKLAGRRKTLLAGFGAVLMLAAYQLRTSNREPPVPPTESIDRAHGSLPCEIRRGRIFISGKELQLPATPAALAQLLGAPSRTAGADGEILLWDDLGIYAQLEYHRERISTVAWVLRPGLAPFEPKKLARGELVLDQASLRHDTPLWQLVTSVQGVRIEDLYLPNLRGYELPAPDSRLVKLTLDGEHIAQLSVSYIEPK